MIASSVLCICARFTRGVTGEESLLRVIARYAVFAPTVREVSPQGGLMRASGPPTARD